MTKPAPLASAADIRRWRRLTDAANAAVERPADRLLATDFKHCAEVAQHRAVLPDQDREKVRPFLALIGFGRAWPAMATGDRRMNADAVLVAVEGCLAQLGEEPTPVSDPPDPSASWRSRADIGG